MQYWVQINEWKRSLVVNELNVKFFDADSYEVDTARGHMFVTMIVNPVKLISTVF